MYNSYVKFKKCCKVGCKRMFDMEWQYIGTSYILYTIYVTYIVNY